VSATTTTTTTTRTTKQNLDPRCTYVPTRVKKSLSVGNIPQGTPILAEGFCPDASQTKQNKTKQNNHTPDILDLLHSLECVLSFSQCFYKYQCVIYFC
jgi:hypothetical protein